MRRSVALMTMTVALAATVFTGCGQSENGGAKPLEENPTPVHGDKEDGGAVAPAVRGSDAEVEDGGTVENADRDMAEEYFAALDKVQSVDEEKKLLTEFGEWLEENGYKIRVEDADGKHVLSCPYFPPVTPWISHSFLDIHNLELLPRLPLEENPTPVRKDGKDGGAADAVTKTEGGIPKGEVMSLPKDFALEYTTKTAGVLPSDERFISVQPDKSGGFLLMAGTVAYEDEGRTRTFVASVKKRQTEERCLNFYNGAIRAGFFGLKDKYEEMEFGGIGTTVKITANGSTKTVYVYGTRVEEFDLVVSAIQALSR